MAFVTGRNPSTFELYLMNSDGNGQIFLVAILQTSGQVDPEWAPVIVLQSPVETLCGLIAYCRRPSKTSLGLAISRPYPPNPNSRLLLIIIDSYIEFLYTDFINWETLYTQVAVNHPASSIAHFKQHIPSCTAGEIVFLALEVMMNKVLILVLVSLLLAGCSAAAPTATAALPTPAPAFSQIIAFGDDLSDTGRLEAAWREAVVQGIRDPNDLKLFDANYQGRFSNGPLAVEILADRLKVGLTSFAVGAAYSGRGNANSDMESLNNSGLLDQIDQFEKGLNGAKADPGALYFINTSLADIFEMIARDTNDINSYADQTIANIRTAITRLAKLGAKQFMFYNTSDIAPLLPGFIKSNFVAPPKVYQDRMNSVLPGMISDLEKQLDI